jgi:uncharacterized damage-inducible protein DinB
MTAVVFGTLTRRRRAGLIGRRSDEERALMISADYARLMARYNTWQNGSLLAAAADLSAAERLQDRGAFFGSVQRTFSHLLWGDGMWMARLDGGASPQGSIRDSASLWQDWDAFAGARAAMDARIVDWAQGLGDADCAGDLTWMSGALGRTVTKPRGLCIMHMFNHQTHHRGQIHAMLTSAGARPGDTDLFIMPEATA